MKPVELLHRLATKRGWTLLEMDGANHTKVTLNGNRTIIARHSVDLKTGILKQLGLKPSDLED